MAHPVALLGIQYLITAVTLGFTSKPTYRLVLLPIMDRGPWAATVGGYSVTYLFHYVSLAILSGCSYDNEEFNPSKQQHPSFWTRILFGFSAAASFRWIGTKREIKNTPPFSTKDSSYIPTKAAFIQQTVVKLLICYLLLDLMGLCNNEDANMVQLAPKTVFLFSRITGVTAQEVAMRIGATIGAGVGIYCAQDGLQNLLALVAVGSGLSEVKYWRPRFGSISNVASLRTFWGSFWHQNNRLLVSEPALYITDNVLRLPKKQPITLYLSLGLSFLFSGILHLGIDIASGIPWRESGAIRFFCMQALGIFIEESWLKMYRQSSLLRTSWAKSVGRIWVFAWLVWTVPGYMYPLLHRTRGGMQDSLLPYSLFANLF